MNQAALTDFGTRYAAAWSSHNPVNLASFYNENGSLTVNGGAPSVGRADREPQPSRPKPSERARQDSNLRPSD